MGNALWVSVTFSRVEKPPAVLYSAYCIACGRSASLETTLAEERAPKGTLLLMRQLRTMLLQRGCEESGVTAAIRVRPPRAVPSR